MATLPLKAIQPTPFQRDLSPTHAKRLASAKGFKLESVSNADLAWVAVGAGE